MMLVVVLVVWFTASFVLAGIWMKWVMDKRGYDFWGRPRR
jgi:hypothetical protein